MDKYISIFKKENSLRKRIRRFERGKEGKNEELK